MMLKVLRYQSVIISIVIIGFMVLPAMANMPIEDVKRLKDDLTPFGAERTGNSDGTIPEWNGGLTSVPANVNFDPALGRPLADPFAADKPLFTITAKNIGKYSDRVSGGQQALLKRYPDSYAMHVYPTRRSFAAPQWVYDNTYRNGINAQLTDDGLGVTGAYGGIAFPQPTKGPEAIFNHLTRWEGQDISERSYTMVIYANGEKERAGGALYYTNQPYYSEDQTVETWNGVLKRLLARYFEPQRRTGESFLIVEPLDHSVNSREVWQYFSAQRRVRRAPSFGYDTPNPTFDGVATYDDTHMFNGPLDRFDWKLIGKKELFVPYHNYQFDLAPLDDLLLTNHHNPKFLRWELHRVWVVEGTLQKGKRHVYGKRIMYLDEDSWINLLGDKYDTRGNLWRTAMSTTIMEYTVPSILLRSTIFYDFQNNRYCATRLINDSNHAIRYESIDPGIFSPEDMLRVSRPQ